MIRRFFALLLSLTALSLGAAQAQVILPPPPGGVTTDPRWLTIDYLRVEVGIDQQIAETLVKMQFTNRGEGLAEGTFLFPLPRGAAVERLTMVVNGQAIDAKILKADEARQIYDEIVRQYRDPALLEYVGRDLIQANVFPIPAGETRQIEIRYGELLRASNGLVNYSYPLKTPLNAARRLEQFSLRVRIRDAAPLSSVYSPSHRVALSRPSDREAVLGFETSATTPAQDFELYYGVQRSPIDANLLTYKASADEDGFFLLMIQPPQTLDEAQIAAKDVVIVLDQSGSMKGEKWAQAQQAAVAVLSKLNARDRFNVIAFSTGWRSYANELLSAEQASQAIRWVNSLYAEGGTDIHSALWTALQYTDANEERSMTIVFMTDGLATEGLTETSAILASLKLQARPNARIFSFGVGDDVDTTLLDRVAQEFGGLSSYVRPYERIDEEVSALYNQISAPVMTDAALSFEGVTAELLYPRDLSALYAGEQITIVGRYRNPSDQARITLTGKQGGQEQTIVYDDLSFDDRAGGTEFIARLWATRRIGDLLNSIRLNGENEELVNGVVELSIRYGIITPYTSFLIEEDDILSAEGRARAQDNFSRQAQALSNSSTGSRAVDAADFSGQLQQAEQAVAPSFSRSAPTAPQSAAGMMPQATMSAPGQSLAEPPLMAAADEEAAAGPSIQTIQQVRAKTFIQQGEVWTDTAYNPARMTPVQVAFLSDEYFALLARYPEAGEYLALGEQVIVVLGGTAYQIVP